MVGFSLLQMDIVEQIQLQEFTSFLHMLMSEIREAQMHKKARMKGLMSMPRVG